MIRKRQACEGAPGGRVVLMHCFILGLFSEVAGLILSTLSPNFALTPKLQHYLPGSHEHLVGKGFNLRFQDD